MRRLPFDPEPLLAIFMTKENSRSFVGDLEERFRRECRVTGRLHATVNFWFRLCNSMPPVVFAAFRQSQTLARIVYVPVRIGRKVSIIAGPLAGLTGTVLQINNQRNTIRLSVFFLQRFLPVEVRMNSVCPHVRRPITVIEKIFRR
jgi:hypothetical protein